MMDFVLPPPSVPSLPVRGTTARFPLRRVYCVGRNYAEHAREMGHDPSREPPFFFQKNPDDLVAGETFAYPGQSGDVHHEVELVVFLKAGGSDIAASRALDCVYGYAVGLDMTRRDLQAVAKEQRRPWAAAKAFAGSAPCGALVPAAEIGHPAAGAITLDRNFTRVQSGDLAQLIWSVPETIAALSALFTLAPGDAIMTGTPAGVGPVLRGDRLHAAIAGVGTLDIKVV